MGVKVKIGGKIFDSNEEPIAIIFPNDEERKKTGKIILAMPDKDAVRVFASFPKDKYTEKQMSEFCDVPGSKDNCVHGISPV